MKKNYHSTIQCRLWHKGLPKVILLLVGCMSTTHIMGQNPLINGQYTADPTVRVFNNRLYLYPSHDIVSPVSTNKKWFAMSDYHVFSSNNLTDWTDHGVILDQGQVAWGQHDGYGMWAPECVEHNGRYYLFFPDKMKSGKSFGIGVAVSKSPIGPFSPQSQPLSNVKGIDPCVLQTGKGESYIFWADSNIYMARLADNYLSIVTKPKIVKGLPTGFKEGPFAFERNGWYYLSFPWVRQKDGTECLAYAMSRQPQGPYKFKGLLMKEWNNRCWTNHHSIVNYQGQWYLFYHHNDYSPTFDKLRSVRADALSFRDDGTIIPVIPTERGVGITDARKHIQVDRYSLLSDTGASVQLIDSLRPFLGWELTLDNGAWAQYDRVKFTPMLTTLQIKAKSTHGAKVNVWMKDHLIASATVRPSDVYHTININCKSQPTGINNLKVEAVDGTVTVDWLSFEGTPMKPWSQGGLTSGKYRNVFVEMGYDPQEVKDKVEEVFQEVFFGKNRVYFEVGDSMGYISDIKNHDVRTEGMSYGMMIAVQRNRKDIFDRLYRWARRYMLLKSGPMSGYFAWSCTTDGQHNAEGPASDGELYFITSLIFAANRWGNDTGIDYSAEARKILDASFNKVDSEKSTPLIDKQTGLITFVPVGRGAHITDPSYHLPAFYEVWARWANDGRADIYRAYADSSRQYLHRSINANTGLTPDITQMNGKPLNGPDGKRMPGAADFRYDSWRVPMNIALDYSWACADTLWQRQYANTIQDFFFNEGIDHYADQYQMDGMPVERPYKGGGIPGLRHSVGLVATLAAATIPATHAKAKDFVKRLWQSNNVPFEDGYFDAYYDGLLRLFAFMHLSGEYRVIAPEVH
jgi:oligosaccharide reducing-end xylanase